LENKNAETDKQLETELPIIAETGKGSDNGKLNKKKRKIFQKYRVAMPEKLHSWHTHCRRKCKQKPKESVDMKKRKPSISRIRCLKETLKFFTDTWSRILRPENPLNGRSSVLLKVTVGRKRSIMKEQNG
jgi:hypothetical protein